MGLPARQLGRDEHLVLLVRPHARVLWRPVLALLLLSPAVGTAFALAPDGGGGRVPALAVVGGLGAWLAFRYVVWPFLVWWHTVYAVTTDRVLVRRGVVSRRGRDVPLSRVADVSFTREARDRVMGSGRLVVLPVGGEPLVLEGVPHVATVSATLATLVDDALLADGADDDGSADDDWDDDWDDDGDDDGWVRRR